MKNRRHHGEYHRLLWLPVLTVWICASFTGSLDAHQGSGERPPNFVLILVDDLGWMDLKDDLSEQSNLAESMPERVRELAGMLAKRLVTTGARLPRSNPDYKPRKSGAGQSNAPRDQRRPRVLILGDSISIGYTPFVQEILKDDAVVLRPMRNKKQVENCQGTNYGVKHLDRWLKIGGGNWDVIHFNFGLHDLKRVHPETGKNSNDPDHPHQAPPERYEKQLREIVERLEKTGARLVFATTTPVPPGRVRPYRDVKDPLRYNAIARRIMEAKGITVNDLHGFAKVRLADIQRPVNVHFTREGSEALARQVVEHLRRALKSPRSKETGRAKSRKRRL